MNLVILGFMGSGKSSVSAALSEKTGREAVEMDIIIAERAGMSIPEIFDAEGETGFRARETEILIEALEGDGKIISCGGGIVTQERNLELLRSAKCPVIRLSATPETVFARIGSDPGRPMLRDVHNSEDMAALMAKREKMYQAAGGIEIATDGKTVAEIADEILAGVGDKL